MRSSFVRALIKVNFELMTGNAISRNSFALMMIFQACIILIYPIFVFCYPKPKYKSLILVFYEMSTPDPMIIFLETLIMIQALVLLEYTVILLYEWL